MLTSDKLYSNVVQEMQPETTISEVKDSTLQDHFNNSDNQGTETSPADKRCTFGQLSGLKNELLTKAFSLGFICPEECYELKKDIQNIFDE